MSFRGLAQMRGDDQKSTCNSAGGRISYARQTGNGRNLPTGTIVKSAHS